MLLTSTDAGKISLEFLLADWNIAEGASQLCSKYKCLETSGRIKGKIAEK